MENKIKLTPTWTYIENGDIFKSKCQTITNPVNCIGIMGGGLARAFASKFQYMLDVYKEQCKTSELMPGRPTVVGATSEDDEKKVLLFPTKGHIKFDSDYTMIANGLNYVACNYKQLGIKSLAVCALGCGIGACDWNVVYPMISYYLGNLPIEIEVYAPGTPKDQVDLQFPKKFLTPEEVDELNDETRNILIAKGEL